MAPAQVASRSNGDTPYTKGHADDTAPRDIFPDGIKTSGQLEPMYSLLRPYEDFPEYIDGPTAWTREDYVNSPEAWTHRFTQDEIEELSKTGDEFIAADIPLTGISRVRHE